MIAADFLSNTKRVVQAIELWNECLILLNNKTLENEHELATIVSIALYKKLFYGNAAVTKLSPAIESGKKLLGEASCYRNLGAVFQSVGEYAKAEEYLHKALTINTEIGDRKGVASCYRNLGAVFQSVGEYAKAEEYLYKGLTMETEIGNKDGEAACYMILGTLIFKAGECEKAQKYFENALEISRATGNIALQFETSLVLNECSFKITGNISEALSNLWTSIQICEKMLISLGSKDRHNISFFDKNASPYRLFCSLSCSSGKPYEALHVAELGRARAL
ncbi:unnamed protein product, partial [Porites evermanni]